ncbi:MAG: PKD domain-containing protein [Candidatus Cloacimonetes bacterium]|nr:PKD domain-containing protein [Candidatus Cloacimonadota bacterium]
MRRKTPLVLLLLGLWGIAPACTIGVADGRATASGRPLLWKTRDASGVHNGLRYVPDEGWRYVTIADPGNPSAWMGVNEHGFAILNSYSSDLRETRYGNGELMQLALAECANIDDFVALLDSTNITGRSTLANFGVIDAGGGAAIFETGATSYVRYDTADTASGYIVRANFSFTGGGSIGTARYERATNIVETLIAGDSLRHDTLARQMLRDLSDSESAPFELPYQHQWAPGRPFGYIDSDWSICSNTTVSAAVIEGVLPSESAWLSTLWVMPGNPLTSVMLPAWPTGAVPSAAAIDSGQQISQLTFFAINLKQRLFDFPFIVTWLDTWKLVDASGGGWLAELALFEAGLLDQADSLLCAWRIVPPDDAAMLAAADSLGAQALAFLSQAELPSTAVADFSASPVQGIAPLEVQFTDRSRHQPWSWSWDFDGDGVPDSDDMNPAHTYTQPGIYSVALAVNNGEDLIEKTALVKVGQEQNEQSYMRQSYPNPFHRQAVIEYSIPRGGHVRLRVYDVRGRRVDTLVNGWQDAGAHVAAWNPELSLGRRLPAGVYIYRLEGPGQDIARRLVLMP